MTESEPKSTMRKPRTGVGRSTVVLLGLTGVLGALFVGSVGLAMWTYGQRSGGTVREGTFLRVELAGELSDAPAVGGFFVDPADFPPMVTEISGAIRKAATDPRIEGVYLEVGPTAAGWASYEEIRDALGVLREAGKPCVAYADTWTMGPYYVASACDVVALAPAGIALINGLSVHTTYYAGTFEKIGVQAQMLHVGDFKSAVEPYERTGPSEPASLAMNGLLDSLWGQVTADIAEGRGLPIEELRARIDHPSLSPKRAVEAGLVDVLAYPDQLIAHLREAKGEGFAASLETEPTAPVEEDELFTKLKAYVHEMRAAESHSGPTVAVLHAEGTIMSGEGDGGLFGGQALTDQIFHDWMEEVREDEDVKALVVRVNSPGGSALASDLMWRDLKRFQATGRPVVVSMGNYAASGGYYISAPADWIVAQPTTLTGSIGVFGGKMTFQGTYEKLGLTEYAYERGAEADLLSVTEPFTEEGRISYQGFIDDFYQTFLSRVGEGRELEVSAVHEVAQGRVWTGSQALELHLVDEVGGLDVAVAKAASLASLESWNVARWPARKGFMDLLMEDLDQASTVRIEVPGLDAGALEHVLVLERLLASGPVALLPGGLSISE